MYIFVEKLFWLQIYEIIPLLMDKYRSIKGIIC